MPGRPPQNSRNNRDLVNRNIYKGIAIAALIPLAAVLAVMHLQLTETFTRIAHRQMDVVVTENAQKLNSFVTERLAGLHLIAESQSPAYLNKAQLFRFLEQMRRTHGEGYLELALLNEEGKTVARVGSSAPEDPNKEKPPFNSASRDYVSDLYWAKPTQPYIFLYVEMPEGERSWILRAATDASPVLRSLEDLRLGATGVLGLLNRSGRLEPLMNRERFPSDQDLAALLNSGTGSVAPGKSGVLEHNGVLYAMSRQIDGEWTMILRQDKDEALAPLHSSQKTLLLVLGAVSLVMLGLAFFMARRIVGQVDRMEKENDALNSQLLEAGKLGALGEMAAGVAHEINNPLAIMMEEAGWIEDLLQDMPKDSNTQEITRAAGQIARQAGRCRTITHKLLSFARKADHEAKDVSLNSVIREIVGLMAPRTQTSGIRLNLNLDRNIPPVHAAPAELQQILLNLLNNAFDALEGKSAGTVRLSTAMEGARFIVLTVADNGPGIPPKVLTRIYEPFFTTKPVGKGTGLGLSICYGLVHQMGGEISVDSAVGRGTAIQVLLPVAPAQVSNLADARLAATADAVRQAAESAAAQADAKPNKPE